MHGYAGGGGRKKYGCSCCNSQRCKCFTANNFCLESGDGCSSSNVPPVKSTAGIYVSVHVGLLHSGLHVHTAV